MVGREGTQCLLERRQWLLSRRGAYKSPKGHPRMALGYFILKALLLYPPPAIVVRLHGRITTYLFSYRKRWIYWTCEKKPVSSVGSAILGKAQDAQYPPQGAHCHEDSFFHFLGGIVK